MAEKIKYIEFDGIKLMNNNLFVFFDEKRAVDKLIIDNKTMNLWRVLMFDNTKAIIKFKQKIKIDDDKTLKLTLAEHEASYSEAKTNLKKYLKFVMSDTLIHIDHMYNATNNLT